MEYKKGPIKMENHENRGSGRTSRMLKEALSLLPAMEEERVLIYCGSFCELSPIIKLFVNIINEAEIPFKCLNGNRFIIGGNQFVFDYWADEDYNEKYGGCRFRRVFYDHNVKRFCVYRTKMKDRRKIQVIESMLGTEKVTVFRRMVLLGGRSPEYAAEWICKFWDKSTFPELGVLQNKIEIKGIIPDDCRYSLKRVTKC